jgi:hypothetical protein
MTETEDTLLNSIETYTAALFPLFTKNDRLTLHYIQSRALAKAFLDLYDRLETTLDPPTPSALLVPI